MSGLAENSQSDAPSARVESGMAWAEPLMILCAGPMLPQMELSPAERNAYEAQAYPELIEWEATTPKPAGSTDAECAQPVKAE